MENRDRIPPERPATLRTPASLWILLVAIAGTAHGGSYRNVQVNHNQNNPEETSITINPIDPENVLSVAQGADCFYYPSFDAGTTWTEGALSDPHALGDPSVAFDHSGNAYYCYIGQWNHSGIFVNRSTDGGLTWKPAGTAVIEREGRVPFDDKSYAVCDWTDGPHGGNLYVGWTQFTHYGSADPADSTWILFSRSTDSGESFSDPVRVSDRGGDAIDSDETVEGADPTVGPDGTVYVAWAGPRGIEFDRSTDGGLTFGRDRVISDIPGGWDFQVYGIYRCNGLPVTRTDLSSGPYRGRVYVNWSDQRNGDTDVFLLYSDDGGQSWGPRVRVNDDPIGDGRDQFFTWFDVDPVTGIVYVIFYDRREHPDNLTTDVYLAYAGDGGEHFANIKISESPFVPNDHIFIGDYTGISAFDGRVRPLWMRLDGYTLSIWTALIDRPSADVCTTLGRSDQWIVFPNPTRSTAWILCCGTLEGPIHLAIHDVAGRLVRRLDRDGTESPITWNLRGDAGLQVAAGVYIVSGERRKPARVVVVR